jgi:hypothetical protein
MKTLFEDARIKGAANLPWGASIIVLAQKVPPAS